MLSAVIKPVYQFTGLDIDVEDPALLFSQILVLSSFILLLSHAVRQFLEEVANLEHCKLSPSPCWVGEVQQYSGGLRSS